ncbi:MAG: hypothetical protein QP772_04350, partial [Actinomycetaceae bacterium UMB1218B]|nr:hypothetical protein [Actinomycetaceae bacterium UMB1218B]
MSAFPMPEPQSMKPQRGGNNTDRPRLGPMTLTLLILVGIGAIIYAASVVWTEILWFRQMHSVRIVLTQWIAHAGLFVFGFLVAAGLILWSLNYAY